MERETPFYRFNTVVVGSGAAGLCAALHLWESGVRSVALVTEGMKTGTSRNTGSDKQTYYKLTLSGKEPDSVREMAKTLFSGGCVDGDLALCEAAGSVRAFFRLVELGVPFPANGSGEYVGYKTDHDPRTRATSAGPYTSRYMTEALERRVRELGVRIFDRQMAVRLLTEEEAGGRRAVGVLALNLAALSDEAERFSVFAASNVVWATGSEAGMYRASVYPASQWGSTGVLFEAGASGKNLTESQYGLASTRFRWNLSGTYQQCLPRYISTDRDGGDEREFLEEGFSSAGKLLDAVFLKGYQWPFDPRKMANEGSSLIDVLVYREEVIRGRRVMLDFTRNPSRLMRGGHPDFSLLGGEALSYLRNCGALLETPFERLERMNPAAVGVYRDHGIDLARDRVDVSVCAQHNNGGIAADAWWESGIRRLFPVGEVNGSHGVYRPGGTALNAGQVGAMRAAEYIAHRGTEEPPEKEPFLARHGDSLRALRRLAADALGGGEAPDLPAEIAALQDRMTRHGAFIRSREGVRQAMEENRSQHRALLTRLRVRQAGELPMLFRLLDLLTAQYVYLSALDDCISRGGASRGSYLIYDPAGTLPKPGLEECFRCVPGEGDTGHIQEVTYDPRTETCRFLWRPVRPIPEENQWFETVWRSWREGEIYD